ncbi:MAG: methyltransferase domain-containing protein [Candidatus Latescibacterota bacterium]|nr:methyltransferase domain-containing protein [Candidatus Latescibacterota bacterium]
MSEPRFPNKAANAKGTKHRLIVLQSSRVYPRLSGIRSSKGFLGRVIRTLTQPARLAEYRINAKDYDYALRQLISDLPSLPMDLLVPESVLTKINTPLDTHFERVISVPADYTDRVISAELSPDAVDRYQEITLLYPDAIGIGWGAIERELRRLGIPLTVLNGRGRSFVLDRNTRRSLRFRRFLERVWGAEILFSAVFFTTLPGILIIDALKSAGRMVTGRRWHTPDRSVTHTGTEVRPDSVRHWWTKNPMVYGDTHGTPVYGRSKGKKRTFELGDRTFFDQVDQQFYEWNNPLHGPDGPFSRLFPYKKYRGKRVLEIGCGMGTMSMNWARHGAKITPIDLTPTAVRQTRRRFTLHGLDGTPCQAQAERLPFPDNSFDHIYSWGVLHHTPNTAQTIRELHRILKPGGSTGVMLYNRHSVLYRFWVQFYEGWLHRESLHLTPVELASRYGDGSREEGNPHTWPVTKHEVLNTLFTPFARTRTRLLGTELDNIFKRAMPGLGHVLPAIVKKAFARNWGWSMWIEAEKQSD